LPSTEKNSYNLDNICWDPHLPLNHAQKLCMFQQKHTSLSPNISLSTVHHLLCPKTNFMHSSNQIQHETKLHHSYAWISGPGSSVGIATNYGLDGLGSNPGGDKIFRLSRPALGPTQPPVKWLPGLPRGVKCGQGVLLTTHPLLVLRSRKSRAIPLPTLWATLACNRDYFTFYMHE
jgi:hypothetical protein